MPTCDERSAEVRYDVCSYNEDQLTGMPKSHCFSGHSADHPQRFQLGQIRKSLSANTREILSARCAIVELIEIEIDLRIMYFLSQVIPDLRVPCKLVTTPSDRNGRRILGIELQVNNVYHFCGGSEMVH